MKRARPWSQQPNAGPSGRVKPLRGSFPEGVIELSDSDDEQPLEPHPAKRQKAAHISSSETIDLTITAPKHIVDGEATKALTVAHRDKGKQKAFTDLTNDLDIQPGQSSSSQLDVSIAEEHAKNAPADPIDLYLSQVLEVIPDVEPDHARMLLLQHIPSFGTDVVAAVLHVLFEQPYPKRERGKGKRTRNDNASADEKATKNYGSKDRPFEGGEHYKKIALDQLFTDFPLIPLPHVRHTFSANGCLYAPTHLALREQLTWNPPPFVQKKTASKVSGKGKLNDPEFEREHAWLVETLKGKATEEREPSKDEDESDGACEGGIECGCCFDTYHFAKMVQCPDAHLFCKSCITSYAENQLGQHDPNIVCMDQSGCKLAFTDAELRRFLSPKLLELYERVKQAKEIEAAELDGLEECPFCEYKAVIDYPDEKLFRCEREDCAIVSCRACKKPDHLPKSCKEAEEDVGLNARHKVEEAMTGALMRNCPKCKKAFIKEGGCNKMTCPNCRTLSCYICRQVIKGYDHFDQRPPGAANGVSSSSRQKCQLWDPVERRHDQEVAAARSRAIQEVENSNPEIDRNQLEVELPKIVADANNARVGQVRLEPLDQLAVRLRDLVQRMPMPMPGAVAAADGGAEGPPGGAGVMPLGQDVLNPVDPVPLRRARDAQRRGIVALERLEQFRRDHEARRAALAEQREQLLQRNEVRRRQIVERQERVRQQYEAQRQQVQALQEHFDHQLLQQIHPPRLQERGQIQGADVALHQINPDRAQPAVRQLGLVPCQHCGQMHGQEFGQERPAPRAAHIPGFPPWLFAPRVPAEVQIAPGHPHMPFIPPANGQHYALVPPPVGNLPQHIAMPLFGVMPVAQVHAPQAQAAAAPLFLDREER